MQLLLPKVTRRLVLFAVLTLCVGFCVMWWLVDRVDSAMREERLYAARVVAQSLDLGRLEALSGTEADLDAPEYVQLKAQLARVSDVDEMCRWVYLMGRRDDGKVFFYADSEPVGSEDESPAGQIYEEISAEYLRAFDEQIALAAGPVTDRWGTWISALVPLKDPATGELFAVLGMDVDAGQWRELLVQSAMLPLSLSLLFMVIMLAYARGKAARSQLDQQRRRLDATLHSIGDALVSTDAEGRVVDMNPVAERLTGWMSDEAVGRPLAEVFTVISETTREPVPNPVEKVLADGEVVGLGNGTILVTKDGSECSIADSAAPIRDREGSVVGVVLVFRDVTEERRRQEEHQKAQRLESLGRLAGGVAHDFNNLLTGVLGSAELLKEHCPGDEAEAHIDRIVASAQLASGLTEMLLTFSRKSAREHVPIPVADSIEHVLDLLTRTADPRIRIRADIPDRALNINGDRAQFRNALLNLGMNACDAMPEGGVLTFAARAITLSPETTEAPHGLEPGDYVEISVSDMGIGMDRPTRDRIFEPFYTTKGVEQGAGLGLAMVYGMVTDHGGAAGVQSEPGRGTVVTLYLPAVGGGPQVESPEDSPVVFSGQGRVLVVDDEPVVRAVSKDLLESLGYQVKVASDGLEGLEAFAEEHESIDLVILDMVMPQLNAVSYTHLTLPTN